MKDNKVVGSCECCGNYVYDEENEYYVCEVDLDEDDMVRFLKCPRSSAEVTFPAASTSQMTSIRSCANRYSGDKAQAKHGA